MTRGQKLLVLVIVVELALAVFLFAKAKPVVLMTAGMGSVEKSVAEEIRVLEKRMNGRAADAWMNLAEVYRAFGLFPQADQAFQQLKLLDPGDVGHIYFQATCLDRMGQLSRARELYQQVIQIHGHDPELQSMIKHAWLNIGLSWLRENNLTNAEPALRNALPLPKAGIFLARPLIRAGRVDEAKAILLELRKSNPDVLDLNLLLSYAATASGDTAGAARYLEEAERTPKRPQLADPTIAIAHGRRELHGSLSHYLKGLTSEKNGSLSVAEEEAKLALAELWTIDYERLLARLELKSNRIPTAIQRLEATASHLAFDEHTLDLLGDAYLVMGDEAKARAAWVRALELMPSANLHNKLAASFKRSGNDAAARRHEGMSKYHAGRSAWLQNDLPTTSKYLEEAVLLETNDAQLWYYLAETRRQTGDINGARIAFERCLQLKPNHGRALRALSQK